MINAIVVDDETDALEGLKMLLEKFCPDIRIIGDSTEIGDAVRLLSEKKPELLFLDIELGKGTAFDLLAKVGKIDFMIIFTTAHERYMIQAIRASAFDYLLKPVDPEELIAAVSRYKAVRSRQQQWASEALFPVPLKNDCKKIGVPTTAGIQFIRTDDIVRLEASSNYTYVHVCQHKPLLVTRTLKAFETVLPEQKFIRIHQSHIVNVEFLSSYDKSNGGSITMTDQKVLPVSRSRRSEIKFIINGIYPTL